MVALRFMVSTLGINPTQFRDEIIIPTLKCMARIIDPAMYSSAAVDLLLGTACAESQLHYICQLNSGPALGFYQMEPATYADIVAYCDRKGEDFKNKVVYCIYQEMHREMPHGEQLKYNLRLQTVFARLHYWRVPEPIPEAPRLQGQYWKKFHNTPEGKGTLAHYLNSYPALV